MTILTASPGNALLGTAAIPGDKSCSHRALILAAMAEGESVITGLNEADDVMCTLAAIEAFGVEVGRLDDGRWRVRGDRWRSPEAPIDCGNSGTTARLLIGAVAGMPGVSATFIGRCVAQRAADEADGGAPASHGGDDRGRRHAAAHCPRRFAGRD